MVRMIRPGGGVFYADETRVDEYRAAGCRLANEQTGVSNLDTPKANTADGREAVPFKRADARQHAADELPRRRRKRKE